MSNLSDKLRHIGDRWAVECGRYTDAAPRNQGILSTTGGQERALDMPYALCSRQGER